MSDLPASDPHQPLPTDAGEHAVLTVLGAVGRLQGIARMGTNLPECDSRSRVSKALADWLREVPRIETLRTTLGAVRDAVIVARGDGPPVEMGYRTEASALDMLWAIWNHAVSFLQRNDGAVRAGSRILCDQLETMILPGDLGHLRVELIKEFAKGREQSRRATIAERMGGPLPIPGSGEGVTPANENSPPPPLDSVPDPKPPKAKRSTERGEARAKLIAALTKHHKYADGGCLNPEPISVSKLAKETEVAKSTVSAFFKEAFGGHTPYRNRACTDTGRLVSALKLLNNEFAPRHLYGPVPPGEDNRAEEG